jgi:rSAM/selenodomain-associated transferase 2
MGQLGKSDGNKDKGKHMARSPISIVIPTLNAGGTLPGCAAALMEGLNAGLIREVIVTDGGSTDNTEAVAEAIGANWITGPASRGGQLRRGADAAQGEWLMFLHAHTQLEPGWTDAVAGFIARPDKGGKAGYCRLAFAAPGLAPRVIATWANLRSRLFHLPFGDQGLLIRADHYAGTGGYPDQPLMEDVALARRLKSALIPLRATARTSFDRYATQGPLRRGARNLMLQLRYLSGAAPEKLAQAYRRADHGKDQR